MVEERRLPLLADLVLAPQVIKESIVHKSVVQRIQSRLQMAKRFRLDHAGTLRYADVIKRIPDLIARNQSFARAPYDIMWVEFQFEAFYKHINADWSKWDDRGDRTMGFLIDHDRAYLMTCGAYDKTVAICPFSYELHSPSDSQTPYVEWQAAEVPGSYKLANSMDIFFWGHAFDHLSDEDRAALRNHHHMRPLPLITGDEKKVADIYGRLLSECVGDLRNIVTLLLLLNRPSLTSFKQDFARKQGFIRGKLRQFLSHSTVTIDLDPIPTLCLLGTKDGDGVSKRRHEVRGHWCHNQEAHDYAQIAGCIHEWRRDFSYIDDDPDRPDHWLCASCGGKRWWRHEHYRGTAELGFNEKEYLVR